jgi:ABC-type multidrug transport system ATPase subunit
MDVRLVNLGKRFNREWLFRHVDYHFESGKKYALVGPNGSGKSTLLKLISGAIPISEGELVYNSGSVKGDQCYQRVSLAAPYIDLIEEFRLEEMWDFHFQFKEGPLNTSLTEAVEILGLKKGLGKEIRHFSSGMKQRLKLGLCFFSKASLLILDEPCSNLDKQGSEVYHALLKDWHLDRTVLIGSNQPEEYVSCDAIFDVTLQGKKQ